MTTLYHNNADESHITLADIFYIRTLFFNAETAENAEIRRDYSIFSFNLLTTLNIPVFMIRTLKLKKGDVAVGVSHSGRTKATLEAMHCAKQQGARTVTITNYLGSVLAKESDIVLLTAFCEPKVKATALASHVAQLGIFDALYVLIAKIRGKSNYVQRINKSVEGILRYKERRSM